MARVIVDPNLEAELIRAGVSKSELARVLNISRATMSSRFTARTNFKLEEINKIRELLESKLGDTFVVEYLFRHN